MTQTRGEWGAAPASPVLLHGFMGSAAGWPEAAVDGLRAAGLRPRALDLPGHGRDAGDVDLARLFARLDRLGPDALVGYSMGGRLALAYAASRPERVRRLVLESASPGLEGPERDERRARDERLAERLEEQGLTAFVDAWEQLPLFETQTRLPDAVRRRVREERLSHDPAGLAASLRVLGTGVLLPVWDRLPGLDVRTLLIVGAEDAKFARIARAMAERLPRATLEIVPGAGHRVHLERPEAWTRAIVGFWREG